MGLKHKTSNLYGVQFHPESIATKDGKAIIKNFLEIQMIESIKKVVKKENLNEKEAFEIMLELMKGNLDDIQICLLYTSPSPRD